jgi:integrase
VARNPRDHRLETREKRLKLAQAKEPYWRQLVPGTFLGYYRGARGSAWIVRQRSGKGYAAQRLGIADDHAPADGDVVLSYTQAVKRATEAQVEKRAPAPKHYGDGLTLNQVVDSYLEGRQSTPGGRSGRVMPASTAKVSALSWGRYGRQSIGQQLVTAIDAKALRAWHTGIAGQAASIRGKAQAFDKADPEQVRARRATANRVLTIAKAALRYARNTGTLPDSLPDYWQRVLPFALGDDPPPRMLEDDEAKRLLNAAEPDLRALLTAALMTGGRYSELRALRAADYAVDEGLVRLFQSKTGKTLWQPLTPEGRKFFDRVTAGKPGSALLFVRADGGAWGQSDVTRPMRDAVAAAKLAGVSFKATRATYGKRLLLATRDLELVAKALGHSDSRITRKHYAQYLPSELATAMNKMKPLGIAGDSKVSRIGIRRRTG